jgi:RHS repeat-associated protein
MDEVIARGVNGAGWWYFPDRNGNISVVTDGINIVRESYRYDAFGLPSVYSGTGTYLGNGSALGNRFTFTGREWRSLFGFFEYRARAYNPTLGRFMSEDPEGFDAGDYNLYRYCANDPMDKTDPSGMLVDGYLNEAQGLITIIDRDTGKSVSFRGGAGAEGIYRNNPALEGKHNLGPAPRGDYEVLNRVPSAKGTAPLDGKRAYALEAKDGKRDDVEKSTGRGAFRFHEGSSKGCVTTCDSKSFEKAGHILDATKKETIKDADGVERTVYGEFHIFSGKDTPKVMLPQEIPQTRSQ